MKVKRWPSSEFFLCPLAAIVVATIGTSPAVAEPETQPANGTSAAQARFTPAARDLAAIEERRAITLEVEKLMKNDAAPEQIAEWHEKNAGRLAANLRKLVEIAARKNSVPQPYIGGIQIPRGTSETTKVFLMEGTRLNNEQARIHNQPLQESPVKCGEALEAWQKQNAAALDAQASRASQISAESQPPTLRVPISASIPRGATSELRDFLTQRNAMIDAETEVTARLKAATPEQRQQALEAWRADNFLPVSAMQDAAVRLSNESK